jgi:hypothetical protein
MLPTRERELLDNSGPDLRIDAASHPRRFWTSCELDEKLALNMLRLAQGSIFRNWLDNRLIIGLPDRHACLSCRLKPAHLRARQRPRRKHCGESNQE